MTQPAAPVEPGVTVANWRSAQFLQWSFQHSREVIPTARVSRGTGEVVEFPVAASRPSPTAASTSTSAAAACSCIH